MTVLNLGADLGRLATYESAWKAQREKLSWAADTINDAANRVLGEDVWTGPAAGRYDAHRRELVADLDACADSTGKVASALGACISTLRYHQGLLDTARSKVEPLVRHYTDDHKVVFFPEGDEETQLVADLDSAYYGIRSRADSALNHQLEIIEAAVTRLRAADTAWSKRTLRMLNWNIQQGGDGNNLLGIGQGNQKHDMKEIARRILDGKVDVATLQEVFRDGAEELGRQLNALAPPGERWEVHFGPASERTQFYRPWGSDDFGNVVLVRTGDGLSTGEVSVTDLGPGDEPRSATSVRVEVD
ncbi:hypothetical protein ACWEKT_08860 [Nocardia takedensis]